MDWSGLEILDTDECFRKLGRGA
ncbi:MAG: hypothetical protein JWO77_1010, partial [Ilumatobacteraceae bacterium]|nr:hypothetical protein [Ilumatobacteraceae bacterium]